MISEKIKRSLESAQGLYHRLVLLVGVSGTGKTAVLRDIANDFGTTVINVNGSLSKELLALTEKQRSLRLPGILDEIAENTPPPSVLDNVEVLFDKGLQQDPLRLLQGISRNRPVIASWNGKFEEGRLFYAEIGHPEYRRYDSPDALIVAMDHAATVDSAKQ
jgi:hypothetical protein